MRYEKAENLLHLAMMMAGRAMGVTIRDIEERFEVERRTAERMRDAILRLMPTVQEWTGDDGYKRWRIEGGRLSRLIEIAADDIADLHAAADVMDRQNRPEAATRLRALADRIMVGQAQSKRIGLEPDVELLLESEGIAFRPGPRVRVPNTVLAAVRDAILSFCRLEITYRGRYRPSESRTLTVEPYGILYGNRPYLVARPTDGDGLRHYRLQGIEKAQTLNATFTRDPEFSFEQHCRQSFGVFMEPPFDVAWRFKPTAASDAAEYLFHPDQTQEWHEDGSMTVRFNAGGALEMAWHLQTWGDTVEVVEPSDFWDRAAVQQGRLPRSTTAESDSGN